MKEMQREGALKNSHRLSGIRNLSPEDATRIEQQPKLVSRFYDAVTPLYEFGWGATFHFSPRRPGENLQASQRRHDEAIARRLRLRPAMKVADIGCGVGGPLVTMALATGARITGINFNARQIARAEERVRRAGLRDTCTLLYANYMHVPLQDGTFDALYSFEAICHAPNRRLAFRELHRLLKPGGEAAIIDWALTRAFDRTNRRHNEIRADIESANATPQLPTTGEYVEDVQAAGFEVIAAKDQQSTDGDPSTPWYMALQGRDFSMSSIARTPAGRVITAGTTRLLEGLRVLPAGMSETARLLNVAADALVQAGEIGIFTPSFLVHARRPA